MQPRADADISREEAKALVLSIWQAASRLAASSHWDLTNRATEVEAMAHYMLYDFDAGVEDDR